MKDQPEEKNKQVDLKSNQNDQEKAVQEKPKKKRGRKPKSEVLKNLEKKDVTVKALPKSESKPAENVKVATSEKKVSNAPVKKTVSSGQPITGSATESPKRPVNDSSSAPLKSPSSFVTKAMMDRPSDRRDTMGRSGAQRDSGQAAMAHRSQDDFSYSKTSAYASEDRHGGLGGPRGPRQDYRGNGGRQQNGGKSYRAMDRQQQEAKYMVFVKSIQEMPKEELRSLSLAELNNVARRLGMVGASLMIKDKLFNKILEVRDHPEREEVVSGVLEKLPDGFGFLRSPRFDYISGPDDIYISPSQIRRFGLRTGDTVSGIIRKPKDGEKYFALLKVDKINHKDPMHAGDRLSFDRLSPLHPDKKLKLEHDPFVFSTRLIDIFSPIGKGQRGLLVAPPKVGKTVLLKDIALSLQANHPDVYLIVLLIDERPEEVTDMRRTIESKNAEVISSTFDESANRHVQVAEIVLEKAKRIVEAGLDVVILLDSITRLARAYNTIAPASGKVLTGGIDANALQRPKKFFGAARYLEGAGSLTIIATALVDTGSKMDEVIYEEFKGTGNMEMHMTRKLSNRRIYPALDLLSSGTRRDDLLQSEDMLNKVWILQRFLSTLNVVEGMEFLTNKMKKFKTNEEFMSSINKK